MITKMLPGFKTIQPSDDMSNRCVMTFGPKGLYLNKKCFLTLHGESCLKFMINARSHLLAVTPGHDDGSGINFKVSHGHYNRISNHGIISKIRQYIPKPERDRTVHIEAATYNSDYMIFDLTKVGDENGTQKD